MYRVKHTYPFLVTTEVKGHLTTRLVYTQTAKGAEREAREREAQSWVGEPVVTVVSVTRV